MSVDTSFIPPHPLNTPVLFSVFNRLDTTKQVFQAIRQAKPPRLYVAADGARLNKEGEACKVQAVRDYIMQNIDWECEVKTLFRDSNIGCKLAVSDGIDWFFENEEQGIILEDDILPGQSFFWFCENMLNKYKYDTRVGQISGFNYGFVMPDESYDIFFSKYGFIWGWATWRRSWKLYDVNMKLFKDAMKYDIFENFFSKNKKAEVEKFRKVAFNEIDTWDYQWSFARFINRMYTIVPKKNLITNLGFGEDATHTFGRNPYQNIEITEMDCNEINCPEYILEIKEFYNNFEFKNSKIKYIFGIMKNGL